MPAGTLSISLALSSNVRTEPLLKGTVGIAGTHIAATPLHPSEMFWRQLHHGDFDISEMSLASLLVLADHQGGELSDWVPLPVFTSRHCFHVDVLVRTDAGIRTPSDLAGRRVGVPEYQQTAAVWARGALSDHFGVDPTTIHWFMERSGEMSHGSGTGFSPPEGIHLEHISPDDSIGSMLVDGRLDAALRYLPARNLVDRSKDDVTRNDRVTTLFPAPEEEAARFYEATGLFPVNHAVVIRREVAEAHPWLVLNTYNAFLEARENAMSTLRRYERGFAGPGEPAPAAVDHYPYGLKANTQVLETLSRFAAEQGLTSKPLDIATLFSDRFGSL